LGRGGQQHELALAAPRDVDRSPEGGLDHLSRNPIQTIEPTDRLGKNLCDLRGVRER